MSGRSLAIFDQASSIPRFLGRPTTQIREEEATPQLVRIMNINLLMNTSATQFKMARIAFESVGRDAFVEPLRS